VNFGGGLVANLAVLFQRFANDVIEFLRQRGIQVQRRHRMFVQNRIKNSGEGGAGKRPNSGGHLVEHRSEGEQIAPGIELLAEGLFR
jgi:hypothetical protein